MGVSQALPGLGQAFRGSGVRAPPVAASAASCSAPLQSLTRVSAYVKSDKNPKDSARTVRSPNP